MIGTVRKTESGWVVTKAMNDEGIRFGIDFPLHNESWNTLIRSGDEVEFVVERHKDCFDCPAVEYAVITR